jgi:cysteine-rich repeat protein
MVNRLAAVLWIVAAATSLYALESLFVESDNVQTHIFITICGDGIVQDGYEVCDDGEVNNTGGYGSSTAARKCNADCLSFDAYCGDNVLQARYAEQCDDGDNTSGDLCSASCMPETAVPPADSGSPTQGSIPSVPGGQEGEIESRRETRVVLRGKAYPNRDVNLLLDGKVFGTTRADSRADFLYASDEVNPGTATFGFWARDRNGVQSITVSAVFAVAEGAVTTVSNVLIPPSIQAKPPAVPQGAPLELSGETVPNAEVQLEIYAPGKEALTASADPSGFWALQLDTSSLPEGRAAARARFFTGALTSGFGRSLSFLIGGSAAGERSPDLNGDGKVNLIDFSIFLLSWDTDTPRTDFNGDGKTGLADFSIMLFAWTG